MAIAILTESPSRAQLIARLRERAAELRYAAPKSERRGWLLIHFLSDAELDHLISSASTHKGALTCAYRALVKDEAHLVLEYDAG